MLLLQLLLQFMVLGLHLSAVPPHGLHAAFQAKLTPHQQVNLVLLFKQQLLHLRADKESTLSHHIDDPARKVPTPTMHEPVSCFCLRVIM